MRELEPKEQIMLKALILSTVTAALSGAFVATGTAGPRENVVGWGCRDCGYTNGAQLTGIANPASRDRDRLDWFGGCDEWGCGTNGLLSDGRAAADEQPAVNAITLPSGEAIPLHPGRSG